MPFLEANGLRLHYHEDGPHNASVLVLSNALGTNLSMWDPQVEAAPEFTRAVLQFP